MAVAASAPRPVLGGMGPFLFGASATYSTQAILPDLGEEFGVAGLALVAYALG
jgi:xanthine/uracil permease